jgi:hypothetical protein
VSSRSARRRRIDRYAEFPHPSGHEASRASVRRVIKEDLVPPMLVTPIASTRPEEGRGGLWRPPSQTRARTWVPPYILDGPWRVVSPDRARKGGLGRWPGSLPRPPCPCPPCPNGHPRSRPTSGQPCRPTPTRAGLATGAGARPGSRRWLLFVSAVSAITPSSRVTASPPTPHVAHPDSPAKHGTNASEETPRSKLQAGPNSSRPTGDVRRALRKRRHARGPEIHLSSSRTGTTTSALQASRTPNSEAMSLLGDLGIFQTGLALLQAVQRKGQQGDHGIDVHGTPIRRSVSMRLRYRSTDRAWSRAF